MSQKLKSMHDLVMHVQKALDSVYGYGTTEDIESFGWQATQASVVWGLKAARKGSLEDIAAAVHDGWAMIAKHFPDPVYASKPEKRETRLVLANTPYDKLSEGEKWKDRIVAVAIRDVQ